MNCVKEINRQIETIKNNGFEPKYISLNKKGYREFLTELNLNDFPIEYIGLPILLNPHQYLNPVVVLVSPRDEFLYHN